MDKTERLPKNLLTSVFSVYFCDVFRPFDRLRDLGCHVRLRCLSPSKARQIKVNPYESDTKITHPNDPRSRRDAVLVRHSRQTPAAGACLI